MNLGQVASQDGRLGSVVDFRFRDFGRPDFPTPRWNGRANNIANKAAQLENGHREEGEWEQRVMVHQMLMSIATTTTTV